LEVSVLKEFAIKKCGNTSALADAAAQKVDNNR
jgi:hypothetical protein